MALKSKISESERVADNTIEASSMIGSMILKWLRQSTSTVCDNRGGVVKMRRRERRGYRTGRGGHAMLGPSGRGGHEGHNQKVARILRIRHKYVG